MKRRPAADGALKACAHGTCPDGQTVSPSGPRQTVGVAAYANRPDQQPPEPVGTDDNIVQL